MRPAWIVFAIAVLRLSPAVAQETESYTRTSDVVYGRRDGLALTMDVFAPARTKPNGAAVIYLTTGGWSCSARGVRPDFYAELLDRGYTVFAVLHGSQPRYTVPDMHADLKRAVRFLRTHAARYGIDAERLGICGNSSGGHMALLLATTADDGHADAADLVERASCRLGAVAVFYPLTDFLNFGQPGEEIVGKGVLTNYRAAFEFRELDPQQRVFRLITDPTRRREMLQNISPVHHASAGDPPTLLLHGRDDGPVPIQQSQIMIEALRTKGVEARLIERERPGHPYPNWQRDLPIVADWFDRHLRS